MASEESFVASVRVETLPSLQAVGERLRSIEGISAIRTKVVLAEKWRHRYRG